MENRSAYRVMSDIPTSLLERAIVQLPRSHKIKDARKRVLAALDQTGPKVLTHQRLIQIFQENRERWWILSDVTRTTFLEYLEQEIGVRTVELMAESHEQSFVRYLWKEPSPLEIASSLRSTAYLSHLSLYFFTV